MPRSHLFDIADENLRLKKSPVQFLQPIWEQLHELRLPFLNLMPYCDTFLMEIKIITVFYYNTIFDYPVIWDILDLVSLKLLFVLPRGSVCHLFWKIMGIFLFTESFFICKLNLRKDLESGMKLVLPLSLCITSSICTIEIVRAFYQVQIKSNC